jgi:hypothetical protein
VTVDTPLARTTLAIGGGQCVSMVNVTVRNTHNYLFVPGIIG